MKTLGQRVKQLRKQHRLTQEELAEKIDVERSYIGHIERGRTLTPSREVLIALAEALETPVEDLLVAAGYIPTPPKEAELAEREIETKRILSDMARFLQKHGTLLEIPAERTFRFVGRFPAGYPEIPETEIVEQISIPASWVVLQVVGDSLIGLGIEHGDQVFVEPFPVTPQPRQIVVAQLSDGSVTIKRWRPKDDHVSLEPANHKYKAIKARDVKVLGVVRKILKNAP